MSILKKKELSPDIQTAAACGLFCPSCGTINSAYDLSCRSCSHKPSSSFAEEHANKGLNHLNKLRNH